MPSRSTLPLFPSGLRRREFAFVLLALLIAAVYAPSLYHVARGDQVNYFAEMTSRHGFAETVLGSFDFNRTRIFGAGDELAFRPLLYVVLGLEKYLFGYAMFWWQVFSLGAHLFAVGALYALLCRARGGFFAIAAAAFFAFLPVNLEAVVWSHISPYVLFAGCVLMALKELYVLETGSKPRRRLFFLAWLVPVVLFYETGVWYALAMGGFLWLRQNRSWAWGAWGLAVFSLAFNAADLVYRGVRIAAEGQVEWGRLVLATLSNTALLFKWFLTAPFFIDGSDLVIKVRTMIRPEAVSWNWPLGAPLTWTLATGIMLVLVGFWRGFALREVDKKSGLSLLCVVMAAGYVLVIVLGRINALGADGIRVAPYYVYNFLVLTIAFLAFMPLEGASGKFVRPVVLAAVAAVVFINAMTISAVTRNMADVAVPTRSLIIELERLVAAHADEPDFSFYLAPGHDGDYYLPFLTRRGEAPGHMYTFTEALYLPYFDKVHPKYVIDNAQQQ